MATARIVRSLNTLRSQVNALAPKRSKLSDGWLGDAKHSMRKSDHNPEPDGTVDALDITHDPKNGVDIQKLCDALIASKDRRISYLICNGKIIAGTGGKSPWVKRNYTGPNKHTKHIHVSVKDANQDDTTPWKIEAAFGKAGVAAKPVPAPPAPKDPPKPKPAVRPPVAASKPAKVTPLPTAPIAETPVKLAPAVVPDMASNKEVIKTVQRRLKDLGYNPGGDDGILGPLTKGAILSFKSDNGLKPVDTLDDEFLTKLALAQPRVMVPERANATPNEVAKVVPEANAHWWNKWIGGGAGGAAAIAGVAEAVTPASGYIAPLRELAGDVPTWVWFALVAVIAIAITILAQRGQNKSTEAFKTGERR